MSPDDVVALVRRTLEVGLQLTLPLLLTAMVVGVLISLFQSVTQIQEQTLSFVPKFLAVVVVFVLILPFGLELLSTFLSEVVLSFHQFAK